MTNSSDLITNDTKNAPLDETQEYNNMTSSHSTKTHSAHPLLIKNKFITHNPHSGLNSLVDASAYLFSIISKLKQIKSCHHLGNLQKELAMEINHFQDTIKTRGYGSEYILVSRYVLCATLDDIISNTLWGGQGQWNSYSMLAAFNQDSMNYERFFIILERIMKEPAQYIDLMELMYICLSLGFKGSYRITEYGNSQIEQIINGLYKRIRVQRGDFNKILSPYAIKADDLTKKPRTHTSAWLASFLTTASILAVFVGLACILDTLSNKTLQELTHIGNSRPYETHYS